MRTNFMIFVVVFFAMVSSIAVAQQIPDVSSMSKCVAPTIDGGYSAADRTWDTIGQGGAVVIGITRGDKDNVAARTAGVAQEMARQRAAQKLENYRIRVAEYERCLQAERERAWVAAELAREKARIEAEKDRLAAESSARRADAENRGKEAELRAAVEVAQIAAQSGRNVDASVDRTSTGVRIGATVGAETPKKLVYGGGR